VAARWSAWPPGQRGRLAVGCYKDSWLTDHSLAWDAAGDAVADLNDGMSEDAGWMVFEAWGVKAPARSLALGPRWSSGIYHQRGDLLAMQCERC
jgi:hypothetical protein